MHAGTYRRKVANSSYFADCTKQSEPWKENCHVDFKHNEPKLNVQSTLYEGLTVCLLSQCEQLCTETIHCVLSKEINKQQTKSSPSYAWSADSEIANKKQLLQSLEPHKLPVRSGLGWPLHVYADGGHEAFLEESVRVRRLVVAVQFAGEEVLAESLRRCGSAEVDAPLQGTDAGAWRRRGGDGQQVNGLW